MEINQSATVNCTPEEFQWITERIFENECGSDTDKLIWWNKNEDFLSVGLGHFIWYPRDTKKVFRESFPHLLDYIESTGYELPQWLITMKLRGMPWGNREEFLADHDNELKSKLLEFLKKTFELQVGYILHYAHKTLDDISQSLPFSEREQIIQKFHAIAQRPKGFYPLVDYINFKGSGRKPEERYDHIGWGLLQVLEEMKMPKQPENAIKAFVDAAVSVLKRRVDHSPPEREEKRWLPGWQKRIATYLE